MERRYELDLTRTAACLMVVMVHTAATGWHIDPGLPEWWWYDLADMMGRSSVPLFFMISGTLFLGREDIPLRKFLSRHWGHTLALFAAWSAFYAWDGLRVQESSLRDFLLWTIWGHYHLRFLTILAFLYLFVPVLHACLHGKPLDVKYLLALFGLVLVRENLALIPGMPDILAALLDKVNYSDVVYLGYMVLGYWMSGRAWDRRARVLCPAVYAAVTLLAAWADRWYSIRMGEPQEWLYGFLCAATAVQAVCVFAFFQSFRGFRPRHPKALLELSGCTLGIYLLHPFVLENLARHGIRVSMAPPLKSIPAFSLLVAGICLAATWLLRRIPLARKLVSS